ncbi:MAG: hypothetical protein FJX75_05850 [Armatimonadetes bacterium]|nr:hypothetical protein [Armatimonadota bacterium]
MGAHLAACAACRRVADDQEWAEGALARYPRVPADASRAVALVRGELAARQGVTTRPWWPWAGAAAVAGSAAVALALWVPWAAAPTPGVVKAASLPPAPAGARQSLARPPEPAQVSEHRGETLPATRVAAASSPAAPRRVHHANRRPTHPVVMSGPTVREAGELPLPDPDPEPDRSAPPQPVFAVALRVEGDETGGWAVAVHDPQTGEQFGALCEPAPVQPDLPPAMPQPETVTPDTSAPTRGTSLREWDAGGWT